MFIVDARRQVDTSLVLSHLRGPGLPDCPDAHVHTGFLFAFMSVGDYVLDVLREQLEKYPQYDVAVCGKSRYLLSMSGINVCHRSFAWSGSVSRQFLVIELMLFSRAGCNCVHCSLIYQEQFFYHCATIVHIR